MFRIFTFILLLFLCIFGIFQVFFSSSSSSPEVRNAHFMNILSSTIERTKDASTKHTSIFSQEDIFGSFQKNMSGKNIFPESEFNKKQLEERNGTKGENSAQKNIILPKVNLGVLALEGKSKKSSQARNNTGINGDIKAGEGIGVSGKCRGIIFDPCIEISDPSFPSTGPMFLGKTPIYRYPDEVAF